MKKIIIACEHCGKTTTIKADRDLLEEVSTAKHILCQNTNCKHAYPLEQGFIRKSYLFSELWSFDLKATREDLQGVWRANQILRKAKKYFE